MQVEIFQHKVLLCNVEYFENFYPADFGEKKIKIYASFKNFCVFIGILTQDFRIGKEPASDELNLPTKETL